MTFELAAGGAFITLHVLAMALLCFCAEQQWLRTQKALEE